MKESITRKRQFMQRYEKIIEAALKLFCQKGIEAVTIEEVARQANVGAATVYRYFETKGDLAIESAVYYWKKISQTYINRIENSEYEESCGRTQLKMIFDIFPELFEKEFDFWRFLYEFDAFLMKYHIAWERLAEYESCILNLKKYMTQALEKGIDDGSLSFLHTVDELYFTVTHVLLSMMEKMSAGGRLLSSDERVDLILQIKITIDLLLKGLSSENSNEIEYAVQL